MEEGEELEIKLAKRDKLSHLIAGGKRTFVGIALQYVLSRPEVSTVIAGTKSVPHLEGNLRLLNTAPLTSNELDRIKSL